MEITPEELDDMIAKASGKVPKQPAAMHAGKSAPGQGRQRHSDDDDVTFDPSQVTENMKSFVEAMSGLKGVEFPGEEGVEGDIRFDAEEFEKALRNILGKCHFHCRLPQKLISIDQGGMLHS